MREPNRSEGPQKSGSAQHTSCTRCRLRTHQQGTAANVCPSQRAEEHTEGSPGRSWGPNPKPPDSEEAVGGGEGARLFLHTLRLLLDFPLSAAHLTVSQLWKGQNKVANPSLPPGRPSHVSFAQRLEPKCRRKPHTARPEMQGRKPSA